MQEQIIDSSYKLQETIKETQSLDILSLEYNCILIIN